MKAIAVLVGVLATVWSGFATTESAQTKQALSVTFNSSANTFAVSHTFDTSADAYGYYYQDVSNSAWNYLDARAQSEVSSVAYHQQVMRAVGFLEGYSTCSTIRTFWPNFYSAVFGTDPVGAGTLGFLKDNYQWMVQMADQHAASDDYWYTVQAVLRQINGLYEGYVAGCSSPAAAAGGDRSDPSFFKTLDHPTLEHFLLINAWGDLYQIALKYVEPGRHSRLHGNRLAGTKAKLVQRCSAIIKLLPNNADVVFGHATWDTYESLSPRIIKHLSYPLMRGGFAEHHYDVHFSSSPGVLSSIDDFFTVSGYAQLGVMETTNELYNVKLLDQVVPATVLSWARAVTSNQMATSGADWAVQFARYHSGTYTNQWMVMDLKLFAPGQAPSAGFLTVLEEVPGLTHTADLTPFLLNQTYWPSYNNPYFEDIQEASGYAKACTMSADNCYSSAPRASLFADQQRTITDVFSAEHVLSHNDFQHDKASQNDSCDAIACRGDLEPKVAHAGAFGALDTKVSSAIYAKVNNGEAPKIMARLGPTHDQQPVFCWSKFPDEQSYVHHGHPDCFDFPVAQFPPGY